MILEMKILRNVVIMGIMIGMLTMVMHSPLHECHDDHSLTCEMCQFNHMIIHAVLNGHLIVQWPLSGLVVSLWFASLVGLFAQRSMSRAPPLPVACRMHDA